MNRYHFADESGDPGLFGSGGSRFFLLAMIELANGGPIRELCHFRTRRSMPSNHEFKFTPTRSRMREEFFDCLANLDMAVRAMVVDKASNKLNSSARQLKGDAFVIDCVQRLAVDQSFTPIENDYLIFDAAKGAFLKSLRKEISVACDASNRAKPFKRIAGMDSRNSDGLQIADMVVGALRRSFEYGEHDLHRRFESKVKLVLFG